jgi:DNA-binding transcriptional LysR family regulator
MGIIEKPVDTDTVQLDVLCEDQLVLAINSPQHTSAPSTRDFTPKGLRPDVSSQIPTDALWLVREPGSGVRYFTDMFFKASEITPSRMMELDSNEKIRAVLASGVGCTVLSRDCVPDGTLWMDLGDSFIRHFYAVTPKTGLNPDQRIIAQEIISILR